MAQLHESYKGITMFDLNAPPVSVSERIPVVLVFNRLNGVFIAAVTVDISECESDNPNVIYIADNYDLVNDTIIGGLVINEDGTYKKEYTICNKLETKTKVYESQFDTMMAAKITKLYPIAEQINILCRAIKRIAAANSVVVSELDELLDYIKLTKETNKIQKEFYANSPDYEYISNEKAELDEVSKFEGGLHETLGPRAITGGRVFS